MWKFCTFPPFLFHLAVAHQKHSSIFSDLQTYGHLAAYLSTDLALKIITAVDHWFFFNISMPIQEFGSSAEDPGVQNKLSNE